MAGIYCITNKINKKKYIGQSIDLEEREKDYFERGTFPNKHLKNAFKKYGKENFEFEIIKCCKVEYLDRLEKLYIRVNHTRNPKQGYNKKIGGNLNKESNNGGKGNNQAITKILDKQILNFLHKGFSVSEISKRLNIEKRRIKKCKKELNSNFKL